MAITSFVEERLDVGVSYGAVGGLAFKTTILPLASGREHRNIDWSVARGSWDVAFGLKTKAELEKIRAFHAARYGRAIGFRFKDWSDYKLDRQSIGTTNGDGSAVGTKVWQIYKRYQDSSGFYDRTLFKPVSGTLTLWVGGAQRFTPGDYTVDYTTGKITLSDALATFAGSAIEVDCEFDCAVRFDTDKINASIDEYNVFSWGQIVVMELKDPTVG
jgi:uncharacterized protein (TIGR02217 family)